MAILPDPLTPPFAASDNTWAEDQARSVFTLMLPASEPTPAVDTVTALDASAFCKLVALTTPPEADAVNWLEASAVLAVAAVEMVMS